MYTLTKVGLFDVARLNKVASILNACGKDMARKLGLRHWDNSYLKTFIIVGLCALKNQIFLLYDGSRPVATFMTRICKDGLHFQKLATAPSESGRGVGSFCMEKIEEIAKESGLQKVAMDVYEASKHAIAFYEHRGYRSAGVTNTLKYREIKMEKSL